jgi:L-ascorbate peroxidase
MNNIQWNDTKKSDSINSLYKCACAHHIHFIQNTRRASQPTDKTGAKSQMAQYLSQLTLSPPKSQPMASLSGGAATTSRLLPSASRVRLSICSASSSLSLASSSSYSPSSLKCLRFSPLSPLIFKDQVSLPLPLYI